VAHRLTRGFQKGRSQIKTVVGEESIWVRKSQEWETLGTGRFENGEKGMKTAWTGGG